jgi:putative superfamily III holin-X
MGIAPCSPMAERVAVETRRLGPQGVEPGSLAGALEAVTRSVGEVVEQRVALLRIDLENGLGKAARGAALLLFAAGFAGIVAGALWVAVMAALGLLLRDTFGEAGAFAAVLGLHAVLAGVVFLALRRRASAAEPGA